MDSIDTIIVAGGTARRLGGIDKVMLPLADDASSLLSGVIRVCPGRIIVVGPHRDVVGVDSWVDDQDHDAGPAAAIWSGLLHIASTYVFLSAGDQKVSADAVDQVCSAAIGQDGAWALRTDGSGQPLFACVNANKLRALLEPTRGVNQSPLRLMAELEMVGVVVGEHDVSDIDTWQDVAQAVRGNSMDQITQMWLKRVADVLNVDQHDIRVEELLNLTREVAHGVERKSAPLTTYLLGYAAGKGALSADEVAELIVNLNSAVNEWNSGDQ